MSAPPHGLAPASPAAPSPGLVERFAARAERLPQRLLNRALLLAMLAAASVFVGLVALFFGGATLGDDYEYFLPLMLAGKYFVRGLTSGAVKG